MTRTVKPIALVTGISSGIGFATAGALREAGYQVFGTSRSASFGETIEGVTMVRLDVNQDASVAAAVAFVLGRVGRIDLLVNNAGFGVFGAAEESSIAQSQAVFDTNFFGVMRMIRAVLPGMKDLRHGRIINVSSVLGFMPSPYMAVYTASKHAVEGFSETMDHEVRPFGVRVLLVQPAYTRTSFEENMQIADELRSEYEPIRRSVKKLIADVMATADDPTVVAAAIVKAATAPRPRLRYPAGPTAGRLKLLRRFAPSSIFDRTLRKQMKLDR